MATANLARQRRCPTLISRRTTSIPAALTWVLQTATPKARRRHPGSTVAAANTAPDATIIRAEAIAHARAVIDLCRLAGQPQMAGRFLEENASLDAVRASLLATRAEAAPQIAGHHPQPGPGPATRPWGDVIARTFKLKG